MPQQRSDASCKTVWGAKSHIRPNLLGRHDSLLQDRRGTPGASSRRTGAIHGTWFETEAVQM